MAKPFLGIISDTHGLLRPEAVKALDGAEWILHAGDVCDPAILDTLGRVAPVTAVRGNCDHGEWAYRLPMTETHVWRDKVFYMIHDVGMLDLDPGQGSVDCVVFGHSHRPEVRREGSVTWLNPGSAGPPRFDLPITLARVTIAEDDSLAVESVTLVAR